MSESYSSGPFKCPLSECLDSEPHKHSEKHFLALLAEEREKFKALEKSLADEKERADRAEQNHRILKSVDGIDPPATQYADAVLKAVDRAEKAESANLKISAERDFHRERADGFRIELESAESRANAQALVAAGLREALRKVRARSLPCGYDYGDSGVVLIVEDALSKFPATPDEAEAVAMREQVIDALEKSRSVFASMSYTETDPANGAALAVENALARLTAKEQKS